MTEIGVEAEFALEEPTLKYNRFENDCPVNYAHTEITTVAAHSKVCFELQENKSPGFPL